MYEVSQSEAKSVLALALDAGVQAVLWGSPGVGKTCFLKQYAEREGRHIEILIGSIHQPQDILGFPMKDNRGQIPTTTFAPPQWALRLAEAERPILFLDELNCCPLAVQAALLNVVQFLRVGEFELGENVSVVAACNPTDQNTASFDLTPPLANRFIHVPFMADPKGFTKGIVGGWDDETPTLPATWRENIPEARGLVGGYIYARPEMLLRMENQELGQAWPSPRTWEMLALLVAAARSAKQDQLLPALATAAVGPVGVEFAVWANELDLPDRDALLENPEALPERTDRAYACLASFAGWAIPQAIKKRKRDVWDSFWHVIEVACDRHQQDIAAAVLHQFLSQFERSPLPWTEGRDGEPIIMKLADFAVPLQKLMNTR